jgi:hypothetical protein
MAGTPPTLHMTLSKMDWQRWSDDASSVAPSPTRWLFVGRLSQNTNPIRFLVVDNTERQKLDVYVHLNLALMLTYLDLDYWASSVVGASSLIQTCIEHYLLSVRGDVEKELMTADSATLLEQSFGTSTLREWASRVYHNYGHSKKGRDMYHRHCVVNGVIPYKEEFINYGENHLKPRSCSTVDRDDNVRLAHSMQPRFQNLLVSGSIFWMFNQSQSRSPHHTRHHMCEHLCNWR